MKFLVASKKKLTVSLAAIAFVALLLVTIGQTGAYAVYVGRTTRRLPVYCVQTDEKKVAITFDAAWGADRTESILRTLTEYDVKATFFAVEFWTEKYSELLKKLHDSGRVEIGTHSATHPHMNSLSKSQIKLELTSSSNAIEAVTGVRPTLFRAPFGEYNNTLLETAEELGLYTIQWDVDSLDWKGTKSEKMASRILNKVQNGSIILMHNDGENTPEALPAIIEGLKNKGYSLVTVSELIYKDNYVIDNTGRQIYEKGN